MTSTRIEVSFNRVARLQDAGDLAELFFPGNRNQQHCFLAIWFSLKWAPRGLVPNLNEVAERHGVSRRTLERVRAKMRRLGLIDHVSRFDKAYGYREGWTRSSRFVRGLAQLAEKATMFADRKNRNREKDEFSLRMWAARRDTSSRGAATESLKNPARTRSPHPHQ